MKIIKAKDYMDMSRKAANIISAQVIIKPDCVLGLATGSTPVGTYKQLVEWYNKGDLDFSEVTSVNLDEYKGLTRDNDQSYYYFMNDNLFKHVNINKERTHLPVIVDPSHATGVYKYVAPLAKAAVACGADGLMIEVHNDPAHALSDGPQSLTFEKFEKLTGELAPYISLAGRSFK